MSTVETLIAIGGTVGFAELLKYSIEWIRNNKKDKLDLKSDTIEIKQQEFSNYAEQLEFMNKQISLFSKNLLEKQNQLFAMDAKIRELNGIIADMEMTIANLKFQNNNSIKYLCYNNDCEDRIKEDPTIIKNKKEENDNMEKR